MGISASNFLALLAMVFLFRQFFGKKGNANHAIHGFLTLGLSLAAVALNIKSFSNQGLPWSQQFSHILIGGIALVFLTATVILGARTMWQPHLATKKIHGVCGYITLYFFLLTILAIGLIRLTR